MPDYKTLSAKADYCLKKWPMLEDDARGLTMAIWRTFYYAHFDGYAETWNSDVTNFPEQRISALNALALPSVAQVQTILKRHKKAAVVAKDPTAALPPPETLKAYPDF